MVVMAVVLISNFLLPDVSVSPLARKVEGEKIKVLVERLGCFFLTCSLLVHFFFFLNTTTVCRYAHR